VSLGPNDVSPERPERAFLIERHGQAMERARRLLVSAQSLAERQQQLSDIFIASRQRLFESRDAVRQHRQSYRLWLRRQARSSTHSRRPRRWPARTEDAAIWAAHERYAKWRQPADAQLLFQHHQPLAVKLARRFYRHRESLEDLQQVAFEALLRALRGFDPGRGVPFEAFAGAVIAGTLKRHYRDVGWAVRVPRTVHETSVRMRQANDELTQRYGRVPTVGELAEALVVSEETLVEVLAATSSRATASLDAMVDGGEGNARCQDDGGLRLVEDRALIERLLPELSAADQELIHWYYSEEMSQAEIGRRLGVSQTQVSRMLRRILDRLRSHIR
jgi:RNA polymerase sigma-B factor